MRSCKIGTVLVDEQRYSLQLLQHLEVTMNEVIPTLDLKNSIREPIFTRTRSCKYGFSILYLKLFGGLLH